MPAVRRLVALFAFVLVVAACSSGHSKSASTTTTTTTTSPTAPQDGTLFTGSDDDFYVVPSPLPPGHPGDVIRVQQLSLPDVHDATVYRVMYHSQSLHGDDIAVTGLISVPTAPAPPGGRNIVSWAHGTTGLADECAPSKKPDVTSVGALAQPFFDEGDIVVATDYEGLGTPGVHPYIVGESEARGVIDIVRAARHLSFAQAGDRFVVWGHSQGGHAALFANQIASTWAPELHLLGTEAGAPATELPLLGALLRNAPDESLLLMVADGFHAAYPDVDLHAVLTDKALSLLPVVEHGCGITHDELHVPYDQLVKADPATTEPFASLLQQNDPGHVRSDSPLFIVHGGADELIPPVTSQLLFNRLCSLGQVVTRTVYDGQTHAGVVPVAFEDIKQWIDDRFAGKPAPSGCPPPGAPTTQTSS